MLEIISLAICAVQFLFAIIVLGLTGHGMLAPYMKGPVADTDNV